MRMLNAVIEGDPKATRNPWQLVATAPTLGALADRLSEVDISAAQAHELSIALSRAGFLVGVRGVDSL